MNTDLTVIVVNWNTVNILDDCLHSLIEHTPGDLRSEVVVVDNGSTDGSVEHLRRHWPHVKVIANERNVGFCRGNNQAIRLTSSPAILLLNTDARLTAGCLDIMLRRLREDPAAAVVGPRLVYGDGSFQRWTAGRFPTVRSCAAYLSGVDRMASRFPALSGLYLSFDTTRPFQPEWVSSAAMLVRREALDRIGLLDESIFVYMDDVDLCQRASEDGWTVWYEADATAIHFMGASAARVTGRPSREPLAALNSWFERQHGRRSTLGLRMLETVGFTGRAAVCVLAGMVTGDLSLRSRARVHWEHVKFSFGG